MTASAIALNRFGLGARPQEPPPPEPRRWLLDQFERYQSLPAAWSGQQRTDLLLAHYQDQRREVRNAADADKQAARQMLRRGARDEYLGAVNARLASALDTPAPFIERLVHFWANHFAISVEKPAVLDLAGTYETEAIRPHVLGRFDELLLSAVRHPAMLIYLDQAQSMGPGSVAALRAAERSPQRQRGLNENLAREILELHTLGARSGYTQSDVTEFARALTGWTLAGEAGEQSRADVTGNGFQFRPALHEPGARTVLGRVYAEGGEAQGLAILHEVAAAPATARHLASKLARHFVADDPPPALVDRLTATFQRSGGDLPTMYRALIESPESWVAGAGKFKTPWDWALSSMRALGRRELEVAQGAQLLNQLGQPVWRPGSPAGYDDVAASWAAPEALMRRVESAQRFAAQAANSIDPRALAPRLLPGDALSEATATAIARAESANTGLALLLVSPDFLRR
ncbi:DUF1800 domain-containing protein [Variovorax soli]|uniref:Uncharacterized protein (DUF1800 family) n=1 Tax=Variovorax soli TaxID=376815 RepID=A0ABU1NMS3_9BURK|nr:DUF1800 domain-containing protein [Variovorax soli]MDR6539748.1 uncharacterized protein (DUF1800 family) [Variovorax soli]